MIAARHSATLFGAAGCARSGGVGFCSSTGVASDVGDMKTATEAGVFVGTGFVRAAGWEVAVGTALSGGPPRGSGRAA